MPSSRSFLEDCLGPLDEEEEKGGSCNCDKYGRFVILLLGAPSVCSH